MAKYETGAVRDTGGKGRCDLLPVCALLRVSKHMENSLESHEERNWEKGLPMHCMLDSAMRHIFKYMDGRADEDHLAAAATNLLMALWTEEKKPGMQDIPTRGKTTSTVGNVPESMGCPHYDSERQCCRGTKEYEPCNCNGDERSCDFYSRIRDEANGNPVDGCWNCKYMQTPALDYPCYRCIHMTGKEDMHERRN